MMSLYYVRKPLFGIAAGHVEQFRPERAARLVLDGAIEPFDEKKKQHREAPGSPESLERGIAEAAVRTKKIQDAQRELHRRQFGTA